MKHSYKVRVYYQDTDAGGIVYHSKYLDFAERARSELLVEMGVSNKRLIEEEGVAFVLSSATIQYKSPARLDDVIEVQTKVAFISANNDISAKKTVVFTMLAVVKLASANTFLIFSKHWVVCSATPPGANSPVAGSTGS